MQIRSQPLSHHQVSDFNNMNIEHLRTKELRIQICSQPLSRHQVSDFDNMNIYEQKNFGYRFVLSLYHVIK